MTYKVKISCELPISGIADIEADTEADALRIAEAKYFKDQKNFNVEIYKEDVPTTAEAVSSTGDVRSTERSDDPTGGSQSEGSSTAG